MGKVKRGRKKLHLSAVRGDQKEQNDSLKLNETELLPAIFPSAGLFKPLSANGETAKSDTEKHLQENKVTTKKDKRKERHERFLKKLHASKVIKEESKKAEQRAKTVIVGDLQPLLSALPTVALPTTTISQNKNAHKKNTDVASSQNGGPSSKTRLSRRKQHRIQISEIEQFKKVLDHPLYKANPIGAISEHIKNVIERQQDDV